MSAGQSGVFSEVDDSWIPILTVLEKMFGKSVVTSELHVRKVECQVDSRSVEEATQA